MLITTPAMAKGVNFKYINIVIYAFLPKDHRKDTDAFFQDYLKRNDRNGMNGRPGKAYAFYNQSDQPLFPSLTKYSVECNYRCLKEHTVQLFHNGEKVGPLRENEDEEQAGC